MDATTSIHVTTGPSMRTPEALDAAVGCGVRGFRFPASKAPVEQLAERASHATAAADRHGVTVDLLLDLPGRKTQLHGSTNVQLRDHPRIRIRYSGEPQPASDTAQPPEPLTVVFRGSPHLIPFEVGQRILLGDGEDCLEVVDTTADHCDVKALTGGVLYSKHGIVLPDRSMGAPGATDTDLQVLADPAAAVFTAVLVSFAETPDDLRRVRQALNQHGTWTPAVVAKVETQTAAASIDAIAAEADAILLGRGDLLMSTGPIEFPDACKRIIEGTRQAGKPLIIGTQLLTSMNDSWLPARSEIAYIAHLVQQGVAGLLLSDETTVGDDPRRTIRLLADLIGRYGTRGGPLFS